MVAFFSPAIPYVVPTTMIDVIKHLGQESSLQLCIDAGDAVSYAGSGQTVTDRSGNGNNMILGNSAGDAVGDPTFVGVAGRQTKDDYWRFTGGSGYDVLSIQSPIPSIFNGFHKQNAVFTFACWLYNDEHDSLGDNIFETYQGVAAVPGIRLTFARSTNGNGLAFAQFDDAGTPTTIINTSLVGTNDVWAFVALSYNETTGGWIMQLNASQQTGTSAYPASPVNSASVVAIGIAGTAAAEGRVQAAAVWSRALAASELLALYNATKAKFGY